MANLVLKLGITEKPDFIRKLIACGLAVDDHLTIAFVYGRVTYMQGVGEAAKLLVNWRIKHKYIINRDLVI